MTKLCLGCMEQYSNEFNICPHCGYAEGTKAEESVHMEPGTILDERYVIGKVLGYGGFGVTYIAWDKKLEQKVAIKEYLPSEFSTRMPGEAAVTIFSGDRNEQFAEGLEQFVEEAKRLSKFQNEAGIVKIFDSFKANHTAYIVMEYLDGETLAEYLEREGKISEDQAVEMLIPVMNSLQVVHKEGILHRDIAPENIFITKEGDVKLIDFGASRYATTSHSRSLTVIIKPGYSPEEQYRSRGDQGPHTDMYALAAVMYKMVTGITPPDALERRAVIETKKKDLLKDIHKVNKDISPNVENAILNAMNVQIEDRTPDLAAFVSELNSETPVKRRYGKIKKIDVYAWPLWLKITAPSVFATFAVVGLLLIAGVIDFPSLFSGKVVVPEGMVIVPELEGVGKDEAIAEIEKLGLKASAEGNVESSYIDAGKIVLQKPNSGAYIEEGGTIYLTVSSGSGVVGPVNGIATVPYVVWDTEENAIAKLKKAGLGEPIIEYKEDATVEAGKVISQSVKENEKKKVGTQVTIVVSSETPVVSSEIRGYAAGFDCLITTNGVTIMGVETVAAGDITIPAELMGHPVKAIGEGAFSSCSSLSSITIPNSVTSIGRTAFYRCSSLTSIRIPNSVTSIGDNAFEGCSSLTSITIPSSVTSIGKYAFNGCSSLTSIRIPNSVTSIGDSAFEGCSSLISITISNRITSIGDSVFSHCSSLTSVAIPNSVTSIGRTAFSHCSSLTSITIPTSVISITEFAFWFCESLTSITIPSSVTSIGKNAFEHCNSLTSITIPNSITSIGPSTFAHCESLTSITIPSSVTSIGKNAFEWCSSLTSITIPNGVTNIGEYAFWACKSLNSITIPNSVTDIGEEAFGGYLSPKTVYFASQAQKERFASCFPRDELIVQ